MCTALHPFSVLLKIQGAAVSLGSMLTYRLLGLTPGIWTWQVQQGLEICVLTKSSAAGGLAHVTFLEPFNGSTSSGDHEPQFWAPQGGEELWGGLHL